MGDNKVEGWTNYETWSLALWINNEQSAQNFWRAQASKALNGAKEIREGFTSAEEAAFILSDVLQQHFEDKNPLEKARSSFYTDILTAAIGAVNWYEVAKSLVDDTLEEIAYKESERSH